MDKMTRSRGAQGLIDACSPTFTPSQINLIGVGMRIAAERFERDADNEHMPERLRDQFRSQAEEAYKIVDLIENNF